MSKDLSRKSEATRNPGQEGARSQRVFLQFGSDVASTLPSRPPSTAERPSPKNRTKNSSASLISVLISPWGSLFSSESAEGTLRETLLSASWFGYVLWVFRM